MTEQPQPGATYVGGDTCRFAVWAPFAAQVDLRLHDPVHRSVRLDATDRGYHTATEEI